MVNDITNPREEWPIPNDKITDVVYATYDFIIEVPEASEYNVDDVITSDNDGTFIVTKIIDNKIYMRSQVGKILLTTSNVLTNTTTEVEDLVMNSITDPEEAVHHYYDTEIGYIVDEDFSMNTVPVSNYEYEVEKNDAKRVVKILNNAYVEQIVQEFSDKISGGN